MKLNDLFLALIVITIWGCNFVVIRIGVTEIPPLTFLALRFIITGLLILPLIKWPGWAQFKTITEIGLLLGVAHQGFLFVGLNMIDAGTMSILLQTQVIFSVLIGFLIFKEHIGWRSWTGISLGISGVAVLVGGPDMNSNIMGIIFGILSALFVALSYVRMKQLHHVHPLTYICLINLTAVPAIFALSLWAEPGSWNNISNYNWDDVWWTLVYQIIALSISHMLWQKLLVRNPVGQLVPLTLLLPIYAIALSVTVMNTPLTTSILTGALLTISGVAIVTFRRIQKKQI